MTVRKAISILILFFMINGVVMAQRNVSKFKKVVVKEVIQVSSYTYLQVNEDSVTKWLAVPYFDAKIGNSYYYKGGMRMLNFYSKELDKTFETVYFISNFYENPFVEEKKEFKHPSGTDLSSKPKSINKKLDISIEHNEETITIAELFKNKDKYSGKKIRIKGQVTKFISQVMSKNWIHLQDGTSFGKKYDLTCTSSTNVKVGDIITLEGMVSTDKDFGYGYTYELIIENSVLIK